MGDMNFGVNLIPTANTLTLGNSSKLWDGQYIDNILPENITGQLAPEQLPTATTATQGAIQLGFTVANYKLPLEIDTNGKAYTNIIIAEKADKANLSNTQNKVAYFNTNNGNFAAITGNDWTQVLIGGTSSDNNIPTWGKITNRQLSMGCVETGNIYAEAITNGKIADNAITTTKIYNGAITEDKINNNAVTTDKIIDGAVTNNKIAYPHIQIGAHSAYLGGTFTIDNILQDMGSKRIISGFRDIKSSINLLPQQNYEGDIYIVDDENPLSNTNGIYMYTNNTWQFINKRNLIYKPLQQPVTVNNINVHSNMTTSTYIYEISQDRYGKVTADAAYFPAWGTSDQMKSAFYGNYGASNYAGETDLYSRIDHVHRLTHSVLIETIPSLTNNSAYWGYPTNGTYTHRIQCDFIDSTRTRSTDINISPVENYQALQSDLIVSTEGGGSYIDLITTNPPSDSVIIKISLDISLP